MAEETRNHAMPGAGHSAVAWRLFLSVFILTAWMLAIATWGREDPRPPMMVLVLYAAFSAATLFGIASAIRLNRFLGAVAALAVSPLFVWHFRELIRLPDRAAFVPFACLGCAVVLVGLGLLCVRIPVGRLIALTVLSFFCFVLLLGISYSVSQSLRWHLLKKHTVFGFPAHLALDPSVKDVSDELWSARVGDIPGAVMPTTSIESGVARPTIVFVVLDTLRRDSLAAYGGAADRMPRLNAILSDSVVFEDVLANASWTRPSVASMFTGLYQEHHGAVGRDDRLRSDVDTLAEVLSRRGYETAAFVANWSVGTEAGFDRGFRTFVELESPVHPYLRADGVTEEALRLVRGRNNGEGASQPPLFLYVHYLDPHLPYLSGGTDSRVFSRARSAYEKEVAFLDGHVADLLQSLETELQGPVVSVVVADHGEEFGDHREIGHGVSLYQEVVRLPLYVLTQARTPARVGARLEGRDIFDLILSASEGDEFDPAIWAQTRDRPSRYTSEYLSSRGPFYRLQYREVCMRAVERDGLFVIWSALGSTVEAYDRASDPLETRNIAEELGHRLPDLLDELERLVPAPWADRKPVRLSPRTREKLEALGYID